MEAANHILGVYVNAQALEHALSGAADGELAWLLPPPAELFHRVGISPLPVGMKQARVELADRVGPIDFDRAAPQASAAPDALSISGAEFSYGAGPKVLAGVDVYAWPHNETSTGVSAPVSRVVGDEAQVVARYIEEDVA